MSAALPSRFRYRPNHASRSSISGSTEISASWPPATHFIVAGVFGGQASEVRVGLVEGEQRVIFALNDERRRLDRRQDLLQTGLIQQLAQLVVRLPGLSGSEIAPAQLGVESTAQAHPCW